MYDQLSTLYDNLTLLDAWLFLTTKLIFIEVINQDVIHCAIKWCLFNKTRELREKGGDPFSNQSHLEFLRVTFLSSCADEQAKAAEVMVPPYFWRGYQQPCDIGLSDRTSVALNTPLTLLGQAFLSVSRHTQLSSHYTPPSSSRSLSFHVMVDRGGRARVCMCVPERRP